MTENRCACPDSSDTQCWTLLFWGTSLLKTFMISPLSPHRYGFRKPPHLELKARPKLGEREVTLGHVTEWIEKKLEQEFQVR